MNFQDNKALIRSLYRQLDGVKANDVTQVLTENLADDFHWYGIHPFGEQDTPEAVADAFWRPFLQAWNCVQRRTDIFIAGRNASDQSEWVISMGHLLGLFDQPWLGIPPSGQMAHLRYADFYSIEKGKITRGAFFCDVLQVMQQAGINPLPQQLGSGFVYPGPKTHDGLLYEPQDPAEGEKTLTVLNRMIDDLDQLNKSGNDTCPPEVLAQSWNEDMIWYGPAGIGASYTIERYQKQHQHPFRQGLSNKVFNGHICRFAEGNYAGFFGWPNLTNTAAGGFLGLPANDIRADMRVVDIYRREGDKLAENWVIIDLPWWLKQQGLDVFERCRQIAGT